MASHLKLARTRCKVAGSVLSLVVLLPFVVSFHLPAQLRTNTAKPISLSTTTRSIYSNQIPVSKTPLDAAVARIHQHGLRIARPQPTRCTAATGEPTATAAQMREGYFEVDGFRAFYVVASPPPAAANPSVPPTILVHGFGAQSAHFSKNMAAVAEATGGDVYAVDLLGFGRSEKPRVLYGEPLWSWQILELIDTVIKRDKVFLAGNSVGGYVCMSVAAQLQDRIAGLCLINAAGRFGALNPLGFDVFFLQWAPLAEALGRFLFERARQPAQLRATLEQVYADKSKVDDELMGWILDPARMPEAEFCGPTLFASLFLSQAGMAWEDLLTAEGKGYAGPLLCLWGDKDPWVVPAYVDVLRKMRPDLTLRWIDAGHCPHHEKPEDFNRHLSEWVLGLAARPADFPVFRQNRYRQLPVTIANVW